MGLLLSDQPVKFRVEGYNPHDKSSVWPCNYFHDDVIKWKYFPRCCPFVRGIHRWPVKRPVTRSFNVFFDLRLNKRLSKQWWGRWFETPSRPLWRHGNGSVVRPLFVNIFFALHLTTLSELYQTHWHIQGTFCECVHPMRDDVTT